MLPFQAFAYDAVEMQKMFSENEEFDAEAAIRNIERMQLSLKMNPQKGNDDFSCSCRFAGDGQQIQFETPNSCIIPKLDVNGQPVLDSSGNPIKEDRYYLKAGIDEIKKLDPDGHYWKKRNADGSSASSSSKFTSGKTNEIKSNVLPKKCVLLSMKRLQEILPGSSFTKCSQSDSLPVSAGLKPCITEDYFNVMYNSFTDVMDCFNVPMKSIFPKLMNESGLHVNTWSYIKIKKFKVNGCIKDKKGKPVEVNPRLTVASGDMMRKKKKIWSESSKKTIEINALLDQEEAVSIYEEQEAKNKKLLASGKCPTLEYHRIGGDAGLGQFTSSAIEGVNPSLQKQLDLIKESKKPSCQRVAGFMAKSKVSLPINASLENRCNMIAMPENPMLSSLAYAVKHQMTQNEVSQFWKNNQIDDLLSDLKVSHLNKEKMKDQLEMLSYNAGSGTAVIIFKNWLKFRQQSASKYPVSAKDFDFSSKNLNKVRGNVTVSDLDPSEANRLIEETRKLEATAVSSEQKKRLEFLKSLELEKLNFGSFMMVYRTENRMARAYLYGIKQFANELDSQLGQGVCTEKAFLSL